MEDKSFDYYAGDTRYYGRMENPQIASFVKGCTGDSIEFHLTMKDETIDEIMFYPQGCREMRACGAVIADIMAGESIAKGCTLSAESVICALTGSSLSIDHWAVLAVRSFSEAMEQVLYKLYLQNRFS